MPRVPMTAREQLLLAHERGHDLYVKEWGPFPEHGDPHPKIKVSCSCGWTSSPSTFRSKRAANASMAFHLGKVIAEALSEPA